MRPFVELFPIVITLILAGHGLAAPTNTNQTLTPRMRGVSDTIIVQLFEWSWDSVAKECQWLADHGYNFVQVSPAQEHVVGPQWWTDYQPVSYKIISKRGNEKQFANMIQTCEKVGVGIIADAVWNHMTNKENGIGVGGSAFSHYNYPGIYGPENFHSENLEKIDYSVRKHVQFGELERLADLATEQDYVRERIIQYGKHLHSLGVAGLRIDAAKHIWHEDLRAILSQLPEDLYITQEVIYRDGEAVHPSEYADMGDVQEFRYTDALIEAFVHTHDIAKLATINERGWHPSEGANIFVSNHDTERPQEGVTTLLNYADRRAFGLAHVFLLSYPYGHMHTVYSGYAFSERDDGDPSGGHGVADCADPYSGWNCEHRWPEVVGMVGFYHAVHGEELNSVFKAAEWNNRLAFGRGDKGYVAINYSKNAWALRAQTQMAPGVYCNVVSGPMTADGNCSGQSITVVAGPVDAEPKYNVLTANIPKFSAVAVHVNARAPSPSQSQEDKQFAQVTFCQNYDTEWLLSVYVVGSIAELGAGKKGYGIGLHDDPASPYWRTTVSIPVEKKRFTYHYVVVDQKGNIRWQSRSRVGQAIDGWQDANCKDFPSS